MLVISSVRQNLIDLNVCQRPVHQTIRTDGLVTDFLNTQESEQEVPKAHVMNTDSRVMDLMKWKKA